MHIGGLAAASGVSRFGELEEEERRRRKVVYSKEEGLGVEERVGRFDFLLMERTEAEEAVGGWGGGRACAVIGWVEGRPKVRRPREMWEKVKGGEWVGGWEDVVVRTEPVLAVVSCKEEEEEEEKKKGGGSD